MRPSPLFSQEQTLVGAVSMSASCQEQTCRRLKFNRILDAPWAFGWTQTLTLIGFAITVTIAIGGNVRQDFKLRHYRAVGDVFCRLCFSA